MCGASEIGSNPAPPAAGPLATVRRRRSSRALPARLFPGRVRRLPPTSRNPRRVLAHPAILNPELRRPRWGPDPDPVRECRRRPVIRPKPAPVRPNVAVPLPARQGHHKAFRRLVRLLHLRPSPRDPPIRHDPRLRRVRRKRLVRQRPPVRRRPLVRQRRLVRRKAPVRLTPHVLAIARVPRPTGRAPSARPLGHVQELRSPRRPGPVRQPRDRVPPVGCPELRDPGRARLVRVRRAPATILSPRRRAWARRAVVRDRRVARADLPTPGPADRGRKAVRTGLVPVVLVRVPAWQGCHGPTRR